MRLKVLGSALLIGWAALAQAQEKKADPPKPAFTFEMHGFVGGTSYVQMGNLGLSEGQQAIFANLAQPRRDRAVYGADVRESRFNFSVAGPAVFGAAKPKAVLEIDFFGGFGAGGFGNVSLSPRLRLAYAELALSKNNRIQFGQNNDLIFAIAPVSLAHIAFPVGYGTGNVGWRRPGVFGFHSMEASGSKVEFAWEIGRSQWADASATPLGNTVGATGDAYGFSLGEASGLPAAEARLSWAMGGFSAFATGHFQRIDRTGVGVSTSTTVKNINTVAGNVGGKAVVGPITLAATGYTGKNLGPLIGALVQFPANTAKDVKEMGGWAQAGFNMTKEISVWGFAGQQKLDEDDARAAALGGANGRVKNTTLAGLLQYRSGGYAVGAEWFRFITKHRVAATNPNSVGAGSQYMLTGLYFF